MPVQFTPLARDPHPDDRRPRLALRGPTWGLDPPDLFPPTFRLLVALLARSAAATKLPSRSLPWHVWESNVLTFLAYDDVPTHAAPLSSSPPADDKRAHFAPELRVARLPPVAPAS
mmetsp:Transcript_2179/g.6675  ORF Transcript_2179/g.6675 Transcript_2179/m.6675 type:complete len:116 (-) Transcript_2179:584-931(-)